jgi:hypothetical protein
MYHHKGRRQRDAGIEWDTSAFILCWRSYFIKYKPKYHKENTGTLIGVSVEVGLETNVEKTGYMLLSHHRPIGQNLYLKVANRSIKNVEKFK